MVKTNYYSGLNPVIVQALNNLQYRYSGETPEISLVEIGQFGLNLTRSNIGLMLV